MSAAAEESKSAAPPQPTVEDARSETSNHAREIVRRDSQTASEWVDSQLRLEAEAREALPYSFDNCTRPLGSLRQNVFACLTCHPPPITADATYTPAGICYGCSISCHGEHTLVEIFARRNFTCDCGTTRFGNDTPCTLRVSATTGLKGGVAGEEPDAGNEYNHNFRNRFCGCGDWYVAQEQRGTMYQCLGLASEKDGGCGEDWWHPECLLGLPRDWYKMLEAKKEHTDGNEGEANKSEEEEHPVPPGFPNEDDFSTLICYKCVEKTPWIKAYGNSKSFMTLTYGKNKALDLNNKSEPEATITLPTHISDSQTSTKRKAEDSEVGEEASLKRARTEEPLNDVEATTSEGDTTTIQPVTSNTHNHTDTSTTIAPSSTNENSSSTTAAATSITSLPPTTAATADTPAPPKHASLPPAPSGTFSLLTTSDDWRDSLCKCASCYPRLVPLPQLREEEETYQPPLSSDGGGGESAGTGSLLDRGEAALNNMDRVRAIEGVMAYNHLRDKVKAFLAPFAQSGQAVAAKDVEEYFAKLRGDEGAIREAGRKVREEGKGGGDADGDGEEGHQRKEQSGY